MNTKSNDEEETEDLNFFLISMEDSPKGLSNPNQRGQSISNLVDSLQKVNLESSDAEANKTSISDNNGGRIELEEDLTSPDVIKR